MSADPSSSAGLPGRSRPVLSDLSKETTEEDLWNLDEDDAVRVGPPVELPPAPAAAPASPTEPAIPAVRPVKPTAAKQPVVIQPSEKSAAGSRPPRPDPQRAKPSDTFDDLDGDIDSPAGSAAPAEATAGTTDVPSTPATTPTTEDLQDETPEPYVSYSSSELEEEADPAPSVRTARKGLKISPKELVSLGAVAIILLAAAIWGITSFFGLMEFKKDPRDIPSFPIEGKFATLSKQATFWREPILEGPERDRTQRDVVILPVLELTLGSSSSGAIRVTFHDEKGQSIGDAVTRSFSGGKFDSTGTDTATFPSTAGFEMMGTFNNYVSGPVDPWSVRVLQGPSADAPADQFVPVVNIPVSGFRR